MGITGADQAGGSALLPRNGRGIGWVLHKGKSQDRALTIREIVGRAQSKKQGERITAGRSPRIPNEALDELGWKGATAKGHTAYLTPHPKRRATVTNDVSRQTPSAANSLRHAINLILRIKPEQDQEVDSVGGISARPSHLRPSSTALLFLGHGDRAAVVRFVPTDGIEDEAAVVGAAVFEGLAVDDVVREFGDELRHEGFEGFGILPCARR